MLQHILGLLLEEHMFAVSTFVLPDLEPFRIRLGLKLARTKPFFCSWALSVSQQVRPRSEAQFC